MHACSIYGCFNILTGARGKHRPTELSVACIPDSDHIKNLSLMEMLCRLSRWVNFHLWVQGGWEVDLHCFPLFTAHSYIFSLQTASYCNCYYRQISPPNVCTWAITYPELTPDLNPDRLLKIYLHNQLYCFTAFYLHDKTHSFYQRTFTLLKENYQVCLHIPICNHVRLRTKTDFSVIL